MSTQQSPAQPIGPLVSSVPAQPPLHGTSYPGNHVTLHPLHPSHTNDLITAGFTNPSHASIWDYMGVGPFHDTTALRDYITQCSSSQDPIFSAIVDHQTQKAVGYISFLRIDVQNRVIEIGHVMFSPLLQRTTGATEAIYLLLRAAFDDLGFRRVEWKCNDLNGGSKRAALRLGFRFEGSFRQHLIVKGRNRDSAWFSVLEGLPEGITSTRYAN